MSSVAGLLDLPGRGSTWVLDAPGPSSNSPVLVLLHSLGTTASLSWGLSVPALARDHRVIALDLRWHGHGIADGRFRLDDCADDVTALLDVLRVPRAVLVGYSMGGAVAQLTWRRHPGRVAGLVLCSTAAHFSGPALERVALPAAGRVADALAPLAGRRVRRLAVALASRPATDPEQFWRWGLTETLRTSPWSVPEALAELGRFDSRPWVGEVDVPTQVVVTRRDAAVPARRQRELAALIPDAGVTVAPGGHLSLIAGSRRWLPFLGEAVDDVVARLAPVGQTSGLRRPSPPVDAG